MKKIGISIVIPVYNSEQWIVPTLNHIFVALKKTNFDAEVIVVDDGSDDKSAAAIKQVKTPKGVALHLIEQENTGRYIARKNGVDASTKDNVLFIDSRVYIDDTALAYLESELQEDSDQIWNGHVNIDKKGNIFARFWDAIVLVGWRKYFRKPKRTQYDLSNFDHYPKGTGFFFVPKKRLLEAMTFFESQSNDLRHSSDDTLLIRFLAERTPINLSPEFSCLYHGRSTLKSFLPHAYHRGEFFIDGFLRPGTRFYYPLIAVLLLSIVAVIATIAYLPFSLLVLLAGAVLFMGALFIGGLALGLKLADAGSLAFLSVPFAVVYLAGLWRGVLRKLFKGGPKAVMQRSVKGLRKTRNVLGGSILEYITVTALYTGIAAVLTKGVMFDIGNKIFASIGDATAGFMWLNYAEPGLGSLPAETTMVNYPTGESIGGPTFITYAALWLPIRFFSHLFGPIAGLNIVMYIGYIGAALAGYLLLKRLTSNKYIAFLAGFAIAFHPYALYKSSMHIAYIFSAVFVLMLGSFTALIKRPTVYRSILFALTVALAFYTDGYYILLALVMGIGLLIASLLYLAYKRFTLKQAWLRVKHLLLSALVLLVALTPIAITQLTSSDQVQERLTGARSDIGSEIREYRSNVVDFMVPAINHPVLSQDSQFLTVQNFKNQRSNSGESTNYISYTLLLCAVVGMLLLLVKIVLPKQSSLSINKDTKDVYVLIGLVGVVTIPLFLAFMFSPEISVLGHTIPLPGQLFIEQNINLWRVMSRFFVPLQVVFVVLACVGLSLIANSIRGSSQGKLRKVVSTVVIIIAGIFVSFGYAASIQDRPYDFKHDMPSAYLWLAEQEGIKVIAELPFVDPLDERTAGYVTSQMIHGKKLVNMKDPNAARLNNALGDPITEEGINLLYERRVDAFTTRGTSCETLDWADLVFRSELESKVTPLLCVYTLHERDLASVDDVFAVFEEGFNPSPNSDNQNEVVLNASKASFILTESDLKTKFTDFGSGISVTAKLKNATGMAFSWVLKSGDSVVQSGIAQPDSVVDIDVTVKRSDLTLEIQAKDFALGTATVSRVNARKL